MAEGGRVLEGSGRGGGVVGMAVKRRRSNGVVRVWGGEGRGAGGGRYGYVGTECAGLQHFLLLHSSSDSFFTRSTT